eukprot:COSAG06_NODE_6678_length_2829_cov_7.901832_2_plen_86_part_00
MVAVAAPAPPAVWPALIHLPSSRSCSQPKRQKVESHSYCHGGTSETEAAFNGTATPKSRDRIDFLFQLCFVSTNKAKKGANAKSK